MYFYSRSYHSVSHINKCLSDIVISWLIVDHHTYVCVQVTADLILSAMSKIPFMH